MRVLRHLRSKAHLGRLEAKQLEVVAFSLMALGIAFALISEWLVFLLLIVVSVVFLGLGIIAFSLWVTRRRKEEQKW